MLVSTTPQPLTPEFDAGTASCLPLPSGPISRPYVLARYIAAARLGDDLGAVEFRILNLWRKDT